MGTALQTQLRTYRSYAIGTGRQKQLLDSVQDGDRIVCPDRIIANSYKGRLAEMGKKVDVVVFKTRPNSDDFCKLMGCNRSTGRTIFDHIWVESYYEECLQDSIRCLDNIQNDASNAEPVEQPVYKLRGSK